MARPKNPQTLTPRSMRVEQSIWDKARERATAEGRSVSGVMADLLEGYARGVYELPRVEITKKFPQ